MLIDCQFGQFSSPAAVHCHSLQGFIFVSWVDEQNMRWTATLYTGAMGNLYRRGHQELGSFCLYFLGTDSCEGRPVVCSGPSHIHGSAFTNGTVVVGVFFFNPFVSPGLKPYRLFLCTSPPAPAPKTQLSI